MKFSGLISLFGGVTTFSGLPVTYRVGMEIPERREELLHDFGSLGLIQVLVLDDVVEEFSALTVLNDQEAHLIPLPDLKQLNDVRMVLYSKNS